MSSKFLYAFFLLFALLHLDAAIQHCHTGIVLAAELTRSNVPVAKLPALAFPDMPQKKVFAVVTIKPDELRDLSIFDYSLEINGYTFPCIAIRKGNSFEYTTEIIRSTAVQQLLFVVNANEVPNGNSVEFILKSNLSSEKDRFNVRIPVKIIGTRQPTAINRIPAGGILELK